MPIRQPPHSMTSSVLGDPSIYGNAMPISGRRLTHRSVPPGETNILRAQYDYDGDYERVAEDDISFKKGDLMELLEIKPSSDWWMVRHVTTGEMGYIPNNYMYEEYYLPQTQDWWSDVSRREGEKQLMKSGNAKGTFLVRKASDLTSFVLSIRDFDHDTFGVRIKHYRIRKLEDGDVCITSRRIFKTLLQLITHYKTAGGGLCCQLVAACPKINTQIEDLEVDLESIRFMQRIGCGHFGEVYIGKLRDTVDIAVKSLKPGAMPNEAFKEEARLMQRLRHKNVLSLLAVCFATEPLLIITELMINGSLLEYLRKDKGKRLGLPVLVNIAAQIACGMAHLERLNCIHRDVRAANMLVGKHNEIKIADFGISKHLLDGIYTAAPGSKFPIKWTAPDVASVGEFTIKSEVWSFGVLLHEIISFGKLPYPGMSNSEVLNRIQEGYRMPKWTDGPVTCPDAYYAIMLRCWNAKPESRPTFAYLETVFDTFSV